VVRAILHTEEHNRMLTSQEIASMIYLSVFRADCGESETQAVGEVRDLQTLLEMHGPGPDGSDLVCVRRPGSLKSATVWSRNVRSID